MKYSTQEDFAERVRGVTFFDTADLVCFCSRSKLCTDWYSFPWVRNRAHCSGRSKGGHHEEDSDCNRSVTWNRSRRRQVTGTRWLRRGRDLLNQFTRGRECRC